MRKTLMFLGFAVLVCGQVFADYVVVLKDGTRYQAKAKWTIRDGKALIQLKNGQTVQIDPALIDAAKSDEITKSGLGDARVIATESQPVAPNQRPQQSLGDAVRMRSRGAFTPTTPEPTTRTTAPTAPSTAVVPDQLDSRLKDNFERAYDNVGIFGPRLLGTNRSVRAELTADSEDKVFNALSATAFLIVRNAGVDGVQIDMVELFIKTTSGGAAGRFQMNRADAEAINTKAVPLPDYFVRKVIY